MSASGPGLNSKFLADNQTLKDLSSEVRKEMNSVFGGMLQSNLQQRSEDLHKLAEWYQKARKGRDNVLSSIANDMAKNLLEILPQRYVTLAIENIEINTKSTEPYVKFDTGYELDPIRPYIEFVIRLKGKQLYSERVTFEIKSSGEFKEMEIKIEDGKKKLCLGRLEANIEILLMKMPFVNLDEPEELVSKEIRVDLSRFCIGHQLASDSVT